MSLASHWNLEVQHKTCLRELSIETFESFWSTRVQFWRQSCKVWSYEVRVHRFVGAKLSVETRWLFYSHRIRIHGVVAALQYWYEVGRSQPPWKFKLKSSFSRREKSRKYVQYVSLPTPTAAPSKFPPIHLFFTSKQRQLHVLAEGTGMIASLLATMTVLHLEKRVLLLDF